mmetsp:Transcript_75275/g.161254  ORF Transcript_75275/g.161254 Transcript_75275/m.161254 type:complete len:503 (+) Transcript_75275:1085-2593(+)
MQISLHCRALLDRGVEVLKLQAEAGREIGLLLAFAIAGVALHRLAAIRLGSGISISVLQRFAKVADQENHTCAAAGLERLVPRRARLVALAETEALSQDDKAQVHSTAGRPRNAIAGRDRRSQEHGLCELLHLPSQRLIADVDLGEGLQKLPEEELVPGLACVRALQDLEELARTLQHDRHIDNLVPLLLRKGACHTACKEGPSCGGPCAVTRLLIGTMAQAGSDHLDAFFWVARNESHGCGFRQLLVAKDITTHEELQSAPQALAPSVHCEAYRRAHRHRPVHEASNETNQGRWAELVHRIWLLCKPVEELRTDTRLHVVDALNQRGGGSPGDRKAAHCRGTHSGALIGGAPHEGLLRTGRRNPERSQAVHSLLADRRRLVEHELEQLLLRTAMRLHIRSQCGHKRATLGAHRLVPGCTTLAAREEEHMVQEGPARRAHRWSRIRSRGLTRHRALLPSRGVPIKEAGDTDEEAAGTAGGGTCIRIRDHEVGLLRQRRQHRP